MFILCLIIALESGITVIKQRIKVPVISPQSLIITNDGNMHILDLAEYKVKVFNPKWRLQYSYGGRGQGPGEFTIPISIYYWKEKVFVYDQGRSGLHVLDINGKFLEFLSTSRGYRAVFFSGRILIQDLFGSHLFHVHQLDGVKKISFTESNFDKPTIDRFLELSAFAVPDVDNNKLYVFYHNGRLFEIYNLKNGLLLKENPLPFEIYATPRKRSMEGGALQITGGMPLVGVCLYKGLLLVLVKDEREKRTSFLAAYTPEGKAVYFERTPTYSSQFFAVEERLYFFDDEESEFYTCKFYQ